MTAGPSRNASPPGTRATPDPSTPEAAERRPAEPAGVRVAGGGRRFYIFEGFTFLFRTPPPRGPRATPCTGRPRSRNPTQSAQCPTSSSTQSAHQDRLPRTHAPTVAAFLLSAALPGPITYVYPPDIPTSACVTICSCALGGSQLLGFTDTTHAATGHPA